MPTSRAVLLVGLVAFLAVLAAYVALTVAGFDASGLVSSVVLLLGAVGIGAHNEVRSRGLAQGVDKVRRQTNGELDDRMREHTENAVRTTLREAGFNVPAHPRNKPVLPPRDRSEAT